MRSDNFIFTYDVGDELGLKMLEHLRDNVKKCNAYNKANGIKRKMVVRLMGRNPNRKHNGRHYRQTLPLKYATRIDVYLHETFVY